MIARKPGNVECGQLTGEFGIMGAMVLLSLCAFIILRGFSPTTQVSVSLLLVSINSHRRLLSK